MTFFTEPSIDACCCGLLTEVARFSLHDGPGIRTTVFFKGCPLRCPWCHNPETQLPVPELEFRVEKCVRCGACVQACGAYEDGTGFSREKCRDLETAAAACVHDALHVTGRHWTVGEVIAEAMKDRHYYAASGGGITLSGGEPLAQVEFAKALLIEARKHGLNTCVETSGHVAKEAFALVLPAIDLLLFDWKVSDPEEHCALVGASNELILSNLEMALMMVPVVLRCPLIPSVNDTEEHLQSIVALAQRHSFKAIEVMPYHSGGTAKYARYGRSNPLPGIRVAVQRSAECLRILRHAPCSVNMQVI